MNWRRLQYQTELGITRFMNRYAGVILIGSWFAMLAISGHALWIGGNSGIAYMISTMLFLPVVVLTEIARRAQRGPH